MKKVAKFIGKFLLWVIGIVLVIVLTLPLWIGIVKPIANHIVPGVTGTSFNLGKLAVNPYTGKVTVGDLQLGNPEGFKPEMAATLGTFHVAVDVASVASDVIVIHDIILSDIFASYVSNDKGENNFDVIAKNAAGGEEASATESEAPAAEPQQEATEPVAESKEEAAAEESKPAKKVIIDHILIKNVSVQWGMMTIPLPTIELNDIGRESNGMDWEDAWATICEKVMASCNALGDAAKQLGAWGVDMGKSGVEQAGKAVDAVSEQTGKAVNGMTDAFKGGASAVSEGASKSLDAVSGGASKAVDAVGEQTGKAMDAIKGLFN